MELEALTIDQVAPGEQQPESDHNYRGEKTESGVHRDRHWRHASGWFSYDLKNTKNEVRKLRVTYFGLDKERAFDIYVNGQLLETVKLDGAKGDRFFDVDYALPEQITKDLDGKLNVKFMSHTKALRQARSSISGS